MRLGKRERVAAKVRNAVVSANKANMASIAAEARYGSIRSSANPDVLRSSTHAGYRDNLHGRAVAKPTSGSCRV